MRNRGEPTDVRSAGVVAGDDAQDVEVSRLVAGHGGYVSRLLARFGVAESDVPDATQDVFLVVWRRFGEFEHRSSVTTWLYTICRRVAKDLRRRAYRRHETGASSYREPRIEPSQERTLEARQQLARVQFAFRDLSDAQKEAFVSCAIDGARVEHVAAEQGCPEKTVFSRVYAAREHLRRALDRVAAWVPWWGESLRGGRRGAANVAFGASFAAAIAVLMLAVAERPAPAVLGWPESLATTRFSSFVGLGHNTRAHLDAAVRRRIPAPSTSALDPAAPQTMEFTVFEIETPGAAMAMQQVGFMEFEPRVLDTDILSAGFLDSGAPWYGERRPVIVKPRVVYEHP